MEDNQLKACRAEFEKWATCDKTRQRKANGYAYATTNTLWKGWQAAYTRPQANTEADELVKGLLETIDSQKQTHDALIKKVKIATDALQFYADYRIWEVMTHSVTEAIADRGCKARAALSQIQQEKL